jgi:lysyl-tRNA synthetase class 2
MEVVMPSTVIAGFEYDARTERLVVAFVAGRVYEYANVPVETYRAFRSAFSKGKFFNEHIRDRFECRELTRPAD